MTSDVLKYALKFEGTPYVLWEPTMGSPITDGPPFWAVNSFIPEDNEIYKKGMCCVGLSNLMRRFQGLQIPGTIDNYKMDFVGGTSSWFNYLMNTNRLDVINFKKNYPKGTLLIQNYNLKDQGHVSITIDDISNLLNTNIIHAINDNNDFKTYNSVVIEKVKNYYNYKRHTHICLPQNWLLKN